MQINEKLLQNYTNLLMPVGTIRAFYDNDDHSKFLNFEWERIASGKTLVGIDSNDTDFNAIGKQGGEKTHTLTIDEMPSHNHGFDGWRNERLAQASNKNNANSTYDNHYLEGDFNMITNVGGSQPHNNLQPYLVVAYWRRVK